MDNSTALNTITDLSREFGTPDYVKGGGGNTSIKTGNTLWIKPSGTTLAGLRPDTFVPLDRGLLDAVFDMVPPRDAAAREEKVKQLLQAAVIDVDRGRPSVETPLHDTLRATYVVHTHPPLVNGVTCAVNGAETVARLFPDALWVPYTDPGYVLSMRVREAVDTYAKQHGHQPALIVLENHGVFVSGNTPDEIRRQYSRMFDSLAAAYREAGVSTALAMGEDPDPAAAAAKAMTLRLLLGDEAAGVASRASCRVATGPLTPDHMVYAKAFPFTGSWDENNLRAFEEDHGYAPRVFPCLDALFTAGKSQAKADLAMTLALDGALVVQLTQAFGGPRFLDDAARQFIESWEVESYRESMLGSPA